MLSDVTVGAALSSEALEYIELAADPPSRADPAAELFRCASRARHGSRNAVVAKAMFKFLGPEHIYPEDFSGELRASLLAAEPRKGRNMTKDRQVQKLKDMGYIGPPLDDAECIDVDGDEPQHERVVNEAAAALVQSLQGTSTAVRIESAYFHDKHAGGKLTKSQRHGLDHQEAVLERERRVWGHDVERGGSLVFDKHNDRVCAHIQQQWKVEGGSADVVVARIHVMPTTEKYRDARPTDVKDLQRRFHELYHTVQHDMMVTNTPQLCLVLMEGPSTGDRTDSADAPASTSFMVQACSSWQTRWSFYYRVMDAALTLLWPEQLAAPFTRPVTAYSAVERQTFKRRTCWSDCNVRAIVRCGRVACTGLHWLAMLNVRALARLAPTAEHMQITTPNRCCNCKLQTANTTCKLERQWRGSLLLTCLLCAVRTARWFNADSAFPPKFNTNRFTASSAKDTFQPGFYVRPVPDAVVDSRGNMAHAGHPPGHHKESARKSNHAPSLSPEALWGGGVIVVCGCGSLLVVCVCGLWLQFGVAVCDPQSTVVQIMVRARPHT